MKFRTEYDIKPCERLLDPEQPVVLIGSCFTDNIGQRMRFCRWRAYPNLAGTLFNPRSIANILRIVCRWDSIFDVIDDSLASRDSLWMSWLVDSESTTYSRNETNSSVFDRLFSLRRNLADARTLIVTFGSAWIYTLSDRPDYVVSNCHKFPSDTFVRTRLSISDIVDEWNELLKLLADTYPDLRVIFTVSPVRHLKDGFEGNCRSKAILQLACEEICAANQNAEYFPAYEIVNDDLRDYRFYASDLVHPSAEAVDYIWEKFKVRYLSPSSQTLLAEGEKVTRRLEHRPIMHGHSDLAEYMASVERNKALVYYNNFMTAHPNMLYIDD